MSGGPALVFAGVPFEPPMPYEALPEPLMAALELLEDGRVRALGPGVLAHEERLLFVLPRCYRPAGGARAPGAEVMGLTLALLARYRRELPGGSVGREALALALVEVGEAGQAVDRLEAALALWSDWRARGPLTVTRERRSPDEPGRVHWPSTLRRSRAVEQPSGPVFGRLIRARVRADPQDPLVSLHRRTCAAIGRELGLGSEAAGPPPGAAEAAAVLARAGWRCFADRQRRVLALLARYHRPAAGGRATGRDRIAGLFAPEFEYVWERMLAGALGHEPVREGLTGSYRLPGGALRPGLDLRPDLVFQVGRGEEEAGLMVLDAKHYDYGDWPQTADLTKQLLYRLLLSDRLRGGQPGVKALGTIGNGFLFPSCRLPPGAPVAVRGVHDLDAAGIVDLERPGRVVGLDVDFERVARAWLSGRVDQGLRRAVTASVMQEMRAG